MSRRRQGITPSIYRAVMDDGGALCAYCGFIAAEVDHIIPVSRGGDECSIENLTPACFECNSEKRDLTLDEWASKRRADGKSWPIPSFLLRLAFICAWYRPRLEKVNGRTAMPDYEQFRGLLVSARDVAVADLRAGVA